MARRAARRFEPGPSLFQDDSAERGAPPARVLAGLDEAGYGPLLGPLTIGAVALRTPHPVPDPWDALSALVGRASERDPARLAVGDSKAVFDRTDSGRARLERTVLAFQGVLHGLPPDGRAFLETTPPPLGCSALAHEFWLGDLPARLGRHEPGALERAASELADLLVSQHLELCLFAVRVVPAGALNASFARTHSKALTHWEQCAPFLSRLWREHAPEGVDLVVDRHGGRVRYGELLTQTFPGARVTTRSETPARSEYTLADGAGRRLRVAFAEKADAGSFPVALASCAAKYARELAMEGFNAHFASYQRGLAPTAGYVTDARRWLVDALPALAAAGVDPLDLVRTR
ncbi:MAG: hypothetical protein JNK02_00370 [Planctomycetes bacterium]|nr:hypothetical protein [Planctomycetota bacterium]